ncbi:MAG TPA: EthD family reductase [Sphingobium sp.]|nr:EthD family reductase [Sphingobium sp.]
MHKIVVLYPPQPDPEAFKAYYVATHIPLVRKLPGLLALRYSFELQGAGGDSPYFCVFEADFADGAALGAAMGSAEGQAVADDVQNFAQVAPTLITYPVGSSM